MAVKKIIVVRQATLTVASKPDKNMNEKFLLRSHPIFYTHVPFSVLHGGRGLTYRQNMNVN